MKRPNEATPPEDPPTDESVLDLSEVRAARALAQALELGVAPAEAEAQQALDGALRAGTGREVTLDEAALARVLARVEEQVVEPRRPGPHRDRAAGREPPGLRRALVPIAIAASLLLVAALGALWAPKRFGLPVGGATRVPEGALARADAERLVASLLPPGESPAARARGIAASARARRVGAP